MGSLAIDESTAVLRAHSSLRLAAAWVEQVVEDGGVWRGALVYVVHARNKVCTSNDAVAAMRVLYPGVALAPFIPRGVVSL